MNDHSAPATSSGAQAAAGPVPLPGVGTKDGRGAADHDQPYAGFRPYVFTTRQLLRLLLLRGEILDSRLEPGRYRDDLDGAGEPVIHV